MRVLIIDRGSASRHILRTYLDLWHCRVEEVDTAEGAMSRLQAAAANGD
jgi:CheY-like chemotaxis protein